MRVSTLATLACVALLAVVGVDARSAIHRQNHGAYTGKHGQRTHERPRERSGVMESSGPTRTAGLMPCVMLAPLSFSFSLCRPCPFPSLSVPFPPAGRVGNSSPHASTLHTAESRALFQKVTAELEARNYSRPQAPADGVYGVDVSQWAGSDTWTCIRGQGQDFAIVRGYMESCEVDPNAVHTVANAWAAGMPHVDIYLYPSWTCGYSAATQVNQAIDNVSGNKREIDCVMCVSCVCAQFSRLFVFFFASLLVGQMGGIPFGTLWFDVEE